MGLRKLPGRTAGNARGRLATGVPRLLPSLVAGCGAGVDLILRGQTAHSAAGNSARGGAHQGIACKRANYGAAGGANARSRHRPAARRLAASRKGD